MALSNVYEVSKSTAPDYTMELFTKVSDVHGYNTRRSHGMFIKPVNTNGKKTFFYNSAKIWNELPPKYIHTNKNTFKSHCKKYLQNKQ